MNQAWRGQVVRLPRMRSADLGTDTEPKTLRPQSFSASQTNPAAIPCKDCVLRQNKLFRPVKPRDLTEIEAAKKYHLFVPAGGEIVRAGERCESIYTLYEGWAIRYHERQPGERQILEVLLPGDTIGLASVLLESDTHPVRALTPASLCALDGKHLAQMFESNSSLAVNVLQTRLEDERRIDERMFMLGRMNGPERVGYLLVETHYRLRQRGLAEETRCAFALHRTDIADAVGLSKVHVMRALRELRAQRLADLKGRELLIPDVARLSDYVGFAPRPEKKRMVL